MTEERAAEGLEEGAMVGGMFGLAADHVLVQAVKFLGVGVSCALTHYVIYLGLVELVAVHVVPATLVGWVVSTVQSYVLNARYTFQADLGGETMKRFWLVTIGGGGVNAGVVAGLDVMGMAAWIAGIIAIVFGASFNFAGHKLWTFRSDGGD